MLGILENTQIENVLNRQIIGRIGCHADGVIYIVPISYAYDGKYVYGRSLEGMKVSIMRKDPGVCFQVDDMKDMANWESVIAWGVYEELQETTARKKALKLLLDRTLPLVSSETTHLSQFWPFPDRDINNISGIVFRIHLRKKTGRFESNATHPLF